MKHTIAAIILTLFTATAIAEDRQQKVDALCTEMGKMADTVMQGRQSGISVSRQIEIASNGNHRRIILYAYESPKYSTRQAQSEAANEFGNKWATTCLRAYEDK